MWKEGMFVPPGGKWKIPSKPSPVDEEMRAAIDRPVERGWFYRGPETDAFEEEFAADTGTKYACACSSGTTAFWLAMDALGVGPGDEVIIPANTYISVAETLLHLGATVVNCDARADTGNIDETLIPGLVTDKTKAIVVVHMYGHPVEIDPILDLAERHDLFVVEDCAHSMGALYKGRKVGTLGTAAFFSFADKGINACGQAGAVTTDDEELDALMKELRVHGWSVSNVDGSIDIGEKQVLGYNFKISEIQAAVARVQLCRLEELVEAREAKAQYCLQRLTEAGDPVTPLPVSPDVRHGRHMFVVKCEDRDGLQDYLAEKGIQTGTPYAPLVYTLPAFSERMNTEAGQYPVSEQLVSEILSLPCKPQMPDEEIDYVVEEIARFYAGNTS